MQQSAALGGSNMLTRYVIALLGVYGMDLQYTILSIGEVVGRT
jgi:hypothetical protein